MFVIVLLVELTLEPFLIAVILLAVMSARATASLLGSKGLYHELLNVQSLPFLHEHGHWRQGHYVVADLIREDDRRATFLQDPAGTSRESMMLGHRPSEEEGLPRSQPRMEGVGLGSFPGETSHLVTIPLRASRAEVEAALSRVLPGDERPMTNGFPVVDKGGQLCGLVTKSALEGLLRPVQRTAPPQQVQRMLTPPPPRLGSREIGSRESFSVSPLRFASFGPVGREESLCIEQVMDTAPFVVQATTPVLQAHMLFSRCGLRHVVVVDFMHRPVGILTRKSLMPWRIPWEERSALHNDTFIETRAAHSPIHSPTRSPEPSPPGSPAMSAANSVDLSFGLEGRGRSSGGCSASDRLQISETARK